ncbi:MAG: DEAD/DEAH box helicase, partial [Acidobacteria bacterium]|nr:DEAD/DEAH box helicase [Acidobacteriota bacterium]
MSSAGFDAFFDRTTGSAPFPFQRDFAHARPLPQLVRVPTGLGKTAMAVVGWLWRRFGTEPELKAVTPRRLVYCLPMRVLVEQTRKCALSWLNNTAGVGRVGVHVLMGGEEPEDWDIHPEREAIIIGTQDMLMSRALNRGYAASRSRWPIQFGLLNTDCLWIFDEIQLMGAALPTTAQLEAFRRLLPREDAGEARNSHRCRSVWMSATMKRDWLETVDFKRFLEGAPQLTFDFEQEVKAVGQDGTARKILEDRWMARKPLNEVNAATGEADKLAKEILAWHKDRPGTRTIVVVNTVARACELHDRIGT